MLRVASERNAELLCIDGVSYDVSNLLPERPRLHHGSSERIRPSQRHWHEPNSMESRSQAQPVALTPGRIRMRKSISSSHSYTPSKPSVKPGALRMFEGEVNAKSDCDSFPAMMTRACGGRKQPPPSFLSQEQRHKLKDPPSSTTTSTTASTTASTSSCSSLKSPPSSQWGESSCSNMSSSCDMDRKPHYQAHSQHSHQPSEILTLEIAPGVHKPLRGSRETAEALDLGYIKTSSCFCCTVSVSYVADAAYFLCPTCRVISPAPNSEAHSEFWGVGLGFLLQ